MVRTSCIMMGKTPWWCHPNSLVFFLPFFQHRPWVGVAILGRSWEYVINLESEIPKIFKKNMIFGSELDVMGIISLGMSPAVWWFHMIFVCVRVCSDMDRNGIYMEEQMGKTSTNIDQHRPTFTSSQLNGLGPSSSPEACRIPPAKCPNVRQSNILPTSFCKRCRRLRQTFGNNWCDTEITDALLLDCHQFQAMTLNHVWTINGMINGIRHYGCTMASLMASFMASHESNKSRSELSLDFSRRLLSCTKALAVGPSNFTGTAFEQNKRDSMHWPANQNLSL